MTAKFNADGSPTGSNIRINGALPFASQVVNNSGVVGDFVDNALDTNAAAIVVNAATGVTNAADIATNTATGVTNAAAIVTTDGRLTANVADVTIVVPDTGGGGTDAALTAQLVDIDAVNLAKEGVFLIVCSDTQYAGSKDANANVTFGTATAGSILASGSGYAIVKADATGLFACTASNSADEGVYFSCTNTDGGVDAVANGLTIRGCIPDLATWSA
jgi:hypothetical protein